MLHIENHLTGMELEAGLAHIRQSPGDEGTLKMIVRRPDVDHREALIEGQLDPQDGLVGDTWKVRISRHSKTGQPNPAAQLTLMNARAIALVAGEEERWALAGDQLFVDFDLSEENIPPGTRLQVGEAVIEVSAEPHSGCKKFSARFGVEAMKFVNSPEGKRLHLRGINARVIQGGTLRTGDAIRKV